MQSFLPKLAQNEGKEIEQSDLNLMKQFPKDLIAKINQSNKQQFLVEGGNEEEVIESAESSLFEAEQEEVEEEELEEDQQEQEDEKQKDEQQDEQKEQEKQQEQNEMQDLSLIHI
eukprot:TRINITY_DN39195_c0_g1_i1.p3 TRINITY_DN39195_c0_g1~~TRINITY_DN39195_c0_g1_i1.p3  ORF type:complete len:115 (+),score=46.83 TRINITY_DN39195_c0_g1_i1:172-516(+)